MRKTTTIFAQVIVFTLYCCISYSQVIPGIYSTVTSGASSGTVQGSGGISTNYSITQLNSQGYGVVNYSSSPSGYLQLNHSSSPVNNDAFTYRLNTSNTTPGYVTLVRLYQAVGLSTGNNEASAYTVSWTGADEIAFLYDPSTPSNPAHFRYGLPAGFDTDNGQVEGPGLDYSKITNGETFIVYNIYNQYANWYLEFPAGASDITVQKVVLAEGSTSGGCNAVPGSTSSSCGRDANFPWYGATSAGTQAESYDEWLTFDINFINLSTLPVVLESFSVQSDRCSNSLRWKTGSENAFASFQLEKSETGGAFKTLAMLPAKGDGSSYSFVDAGIKNTTCMYRLKMIDTDGSYRYSKIINAKNSCEAVSMLYTLNSTDLRLAGLQKNDQVDIYTAGGQKMLSVTAINATQQINTGHLAGGTYFITVKRGKEKIFSSGFVR